jgi:hypothetical protein
MAPWSDWTSDVAIDVTGCPSPTIEQAVKQTAIDFLERTHWLQRTAAPIDITGGAGSRAFASPVIGTGETVLAILKAWYFDEPLDVYGPPDVEDDWPDWKTRTGDPECIVMERVDGYYVVPAPASTQTAALRLKVAVGLLDTATGVDDSVRVLWRDAIASGAKARLMFMAGKPWSSPDQAGTHQMLYTAAVNGATLRAIRTPARRPLVTRPYFF